MKCPNCDAELAPAHLNGVDVELCPACHGSWLTREELEQLEDRTFDLGDDVKGTLVFSSEASGRKCPECSQPMRSFAYRLYDLELELCPDGHGYWLDANEDRRVMDLMKEEEARLKRSQHAEQHWTSHLRHLRSGSFIDKLRGLLG
jgi:hypothetical protein